MAQNTIRRQLKKRSRPQETATITFDSEDDEGNLDTETYTFSRPTDEQMFLLAAGIGGDDSSVADEAAAVMEYIRQTLPREEYRRLRARLADPEDGLDMDIFSETLFEMIGVWSDYPTQQPSVSSGSPESSGGNSTGRVRGKGSTHSTSRSTGS